MKKPYILIALFLALGIVVVGFLILKRNQTPAIEEFVEDVDESVPELPFDQRPVVSLTPRSDGHWLKLSIAGVNRVPGAATVDYMLVYEVPDKPSQGVPGTVSLTGITVIDRDLLLGSESSGKFRYDEGVEKGELTLRFRDSKKKLIGKLVTQFHLQSKVSELTSPDGKFIYKFTTAPKKGYFVTLNTLGVNEGLSGTIQNGPYGIFSSESTKFPGTVSLEGGKVMRYGENKWGTLTSSSSIDLGVFASVSE